MRSGGRATFVFLGLGLLACRGTQAPPEPPAVSPAPSSAALAPPLADDPIAKTAPSPDDLRLGRADADVLMARLQQLPKFPITLSELEAHLGRPVRRHFNPEPHDPTFVHDQGGTGLNVGGTPIHHPSGDEDTPLLFELRSQYYARHDQERRFRDRPPFAADDPVIDLVSFSDRYANGAAPPVPTASLPFSGNYDYIAEQWHIKPLHDGYVSLQIHDLARNPAADRWVFQITSNRGLFHTPQEVEQVQELLLGIVDTVRTGKSTLEHIATLERTHADDYDMGILELGLGSYNIRFFDVAIAEGDHAGAFLRDEGHSQGLYIDFYVQGEAKVALPRFYAAFGTKELTVDPSRLPQVAAGNREGGLLYYDEVMLEKDGWTIRATGFYPVEDGKAPAVLEIPKLLVQSLTIRHVVP